jgi:competence protein ComEC
MIHDKPAIVAAFAMISGIVLARSMSYSWIAWSIAAGVFCTVSLLQFILLSPSASRQRSSSLALLLSVALAAGAAYSIRTQVTDVSGIQRFVDLPDSLTIRCTVIDEPKIKAGRMTMLVNVISLSDDADSEGVSGKAYVTIFGDRRRRESVPDISYGSVLTVKSILQSPVQTRNPGEFSYKEYLALNDIYAVFSVFGFSNVQVSPDRSSNYFFEKIVFPSKNYVVRYITSALQGDEAYFLIGLLLGDRSDISQEIKKAFMNTGTIHVLAVSGSHVVLVVAIIFTLLGLLRFPRKAKIAVTILILVYYTYLTGATPSVVRASIMAILLLLGKYFEERVNIYNALGVSAVLILVYDPKQIFDVGFQLSFSAVFSIVYFYPKLNTLIQNIPEQLEEFKLLRWLWQAFAVSLAAQIGTIPFTAFYFGKVSLISFVANLFVVPLVGVLVSIGLCGVLLNILSSFIGSCFLEVVQLIAWFTLRAVRIAESVPFAVLNTSQYGWRETIWYALSVVLLFNLRNRGLQKKMVFALLIIVNAMVFQSLVTERNRNLRITFLDVGQGDASVIQFPGGKTMLVDAGPSTSSFDAGERVVAPYLERNGISHLDAVLTTHPHSDHLGGIPYILKHFSIGKTIDPHQACDSRLYMEYSSLVKEIEQQSVTAGMMENGFPDVRLYYLHPTNRFIDSDSSDGYSGLNESSVVFKLQYGETSFLFTGDAEIPAEEQLVRAYGDFLKCDVVKAGHHGSITSSSEEFIAHVHPRVVIVSVGKFNKFNHPSGIVLARYRDAGITIHRTDYNGAAIYESDGHAVRMLNWKND